MDVSRSGYYKWLKNRDVLNRYEIDRLELEKLIKEIHNKKPSYGYRRINFGLRKEPMIGHFIQMCLITKQ